RLHVQSLFAAGHFDGTLLWHPARPPLPEGSRLLLGVPVHLGALPAGLVQPVATSLLACERPRRALPGGSRDGDSVPPLRRFTFPPRTGFLAARWKRWGTVADSGASNRSNPSGLRRILYALRRRDMSARTFLSLLVGLVLVGGAFTG